MRSPFARVLLWAGSLWLAADAAAEELRGGALVLQVDPKGCGFLDTLTYHNRPLLAAARGIVGGRISLVAAGDGTADSLFRRRLATVLPAQIARVSLVEGSLIVEGQYSDGKLRVPFLRQIVILAAKGAVGVREITDAAGLPAEYLIAEHCLDLPLVLGKDEHLRMLGLGSSGGAELYRMDMNDEPRRSQWISSSRAFWPSWDVGGILQLSGTYRIWRANHADTMAYPMRQGRGSGAWADYSELDVGLTVWTSGADAAAQTALTINARKGILSISPHPTSQLPIAGKDFGRREFQFYLLPHAGSWPAVYPCELDFARYRELLAWLNRGGRYTHLDLACRVIGVTAPQGAKTQQQLDDVCRRIIFKERAQPSVVLRSLYGADDGWRMAAVTQAVLGKTVPRKQPFQTWESISRAVLARIRAVGVPRS